ncbi:MAG: hypothetical protein K6A72_05890 [Lachnospiraceae bacterium]|nr:hypothetical protein [Lachnospiraceae bacterium]
MHQVKDRESFIFFLKALSKDFYENHDDWENRTIADYLESISAWIKDNDEEFENIDYKMMAEVFYSGKIYE